MSWPQVIADIAAIAWPIKEVVAGMSMFLDRPDAQSGLTYRLIYALSNSLALNFGKASNR